MRSRYELDDLEPDDEKQARRAYFACVEFLDEIVGDLLASLERDGALENTIVIYMSDHGELAGEHGLWEKRTWHEGSTRVPWIVQLPEHRRGDLSPSRIETPVSLVDLLPTICGLTGASVPDGVDGVDLSRSVRSGTEPDRGVVFCDYLDPESEGLRYRIAIDGRFKYVRFQDAPDRLYDIEADPLERQDLLATGDYQAEADRLRTRID